MPTQQTSTIKLENDDAFVFRLRYGNFTVAKHGYSLDGSIQVSGGDSVKNARIYVTRPVRDQIVSNWPGREGLITATVVSQDLWNIEEVVESEYAKYDPQLRAWNNDTDSFEEIAWEEDDVEEKSPQKKSKTTKTPTKGSNAKAGTNFEDIVILFGACWDAAGSLPHADKTLAAATQTDTALGDVRYKAAFTMFIEARKDGVMPDTSPEEEPEEDEDDLPF